MLTDLSELLQPRKLWRRDEILARPCPLPRLPGVYAWYFDSVPAAVPTADCVTCDGSTLLYVGISPKLARGAGSTPSRQNLASRVRQHLRGNASASTLRFSLGCLLADPLGMELRRVGGGARLTFGAGEDVLSGWLAMHARLAWLIHPEPWIVEDELLRSVPLPLNLAGNDHHPFHAALAALRSTARTRARGLPVG